MSQRHKLTIIVNDDYLRSERNHVEYTFQKTQKQIMAILKEVNSIGLRINFPKATIVYLPHKIVRVCIEPAFPDGD